MPRWRSRLRRVWNRVVPGMPVPLRIAPGFWWIARHDVVSDSLFSGTFETAGRAFFASFLARGMTVFDVGAHAGVYTMAAAKLVGRGGLVVSFEPSIRERRRLVSHLRINRLTNVTVVPAAVGAADGEVDLLVVEGQETGCNSLRRPAGERVRAVRVPIYRLDAYVERAAVGRVDLIKMDIEGGERDALRGAERLFARDRPVLLCEIEPVRIAPWGYDPREILGLVRNWGYDWFTLDAAGRLEPLGQPDPDVTALTGEYVAWPAEGSSVADDERFRRRR